MLLLVSDLFFIGFMLDSPPAPPYSPAMAGKTYSTLELAERLVAMPTVSRDSNLHLVSFVEDYLEGHGVSCRLFENEEGTKANLLAVLGPEDVPGIILSGHTDVVPVDGQDWSQDPFKPWIANDRLYGRGAADMKSFIAAVLARVPEMQSRGLTQPVYIALSYDEELGCRGVLPMVRHLAGMKTRPRLCIVGEPTEMRVINAHKGIRSYRVRITGLAGHSSAPHLGANAIFAAAELIGFLGRLAGETRDNGPGDHRFFPPYTTFNVGEISGGSATNIIPDAAEFTWEFRPVPGFDSDGITARFADHAVNVVLPRLREATDQADIEIIEMSNAPALLAEDASDAETFVMKLARQNQTGTVSYATEAGQFQQEAEIPAIVCGPGNIEQAHKADEWIALDQIKACDEFMGRFVDAVCSS